MSKITYKNLYTQIQADIDKANAYNSSSSYQQQTARASLMPLAIGSATGSTGDISVGNVVNSIQVLLSETMPPYIAKGLTVQAMNNPSSSVTVSAGYGAVGGQYFELDDAVTISVPISLGTTIWYVMLWRDGVVIDKNLDPVKLPLAKIVTNPNGKSTRIINKRDDSWDAYIVNFKEVKLYVDAYGNVEEDTIDILRNGIGDILADNIIGNISLSENLKIINSDGSLLMDSRSIRVRASDGITLSKFDRTGARFYDSDGIELSRFTATDARIGNILIKRNSLETENFQTGLYGFQIKDSGEAEFNNVTVRGNIEATTGIIGGFTITADKLYGTTTGTIQTGINVGAGYNGVKLDIDGLHVYDSVLGRVVYLPSDGSAPEFASGTIQDTVFEINTNAVLRTSSTVGDGSASSYGILINSSGLYGCGANQSLSSANLKALVDGTISISGEITSSSGIIGGVTITETSLTGGLIEGSTIRGAIIETRASTPKVRIDEDGLYYQATTNIGKYGASGSGLYGFKYGDGTNYGSGVLAYLFNTNYPILAITAEQANADIRFYSRSTDPLTGDHVSGDIICVGGYLKRYTGSDTGGGAPIYDALTVSDGTTGGSGSAGAGNQYIEINIEGTVFKVLHDGTV